MPTARKAFEVESGGGGSVMPSLPGLPSIDLPHFRVPRVEIPVDSFDQQIEFLDLLGKAGDFLNKSVSGALDEMAAAEGATEGSAVGAEGTFERRSPISISGRAFNQANLNAYADTVQLRLREKIEETALANPADPGAFESGLESWREGFESELPAELKGPFKLQYQALARSEQAKIRSTQRGLMQDEQAGQYALLRDRVIRGASQNATGLFSGDPEIAETALTAITADFAELDRHLAQIGPDGLPLFSPEVRAKEQLEFRDRVMVNGVQGWFRNHPDKAQALDELVNGEVQLGGGKTLKLSEQLSPEKFEQLVDSVEVELRSEVAAMNAMESRARRARNEAKASNELALAVGVAEGSIGRAEVMKAAELGGLSASGLRNLLKMASNPDAQDDPAVVLQTRDEIRRHAIDDATIMGRVGNGLSQKTAGDLLDKFSGSGSDIYDTQEFKRADEFLEKGLKTTGPAAAILDPDEEVRIGEARAELDERVKGGESPLAVAREILPRYRSNPITTSAFPRPKTVPELDPQSATLEQVQAARAKLAELVRANAVNPVDAKRDAQSLKTLQAVLEQQMASDADLERMKAVATPRAK